MASKKPRRPRDRAYRILKDRLTHADPAERDDLYARAWALIAYWRARLILGETGEDREEPGRDEE